MARWTGTAKDHEHYFEPDGLACPSLDSEDEVISRNECRRYDAIIDQDDRFLVLNVWTWEIVSEHSTFDEACKYAQYLATW